MGFKLVQLPVLVFLQVRQGEIFKQQIQVLIFRNLEDKLILPFAIGAGLPLTAATAAAAPLRAFDPIVLHEMVIARVDAVA